MVENAINNLALSLIASVTLIMACIFGAMRCSREGSRIDLVDMYVMITWLYFGTYTLVDSLINNRSWARTDIVMWVHVMILVIVLITWGLTRTMPKVLLNSIQIKRVLNRSKEIDYRSVVVLFSVPLVVTIYGYYEFGIISFIIDYRAIDLPYWYTSAKMLFHPLLIVVLIISAQRSMQIYVRKRILWIIALVSSACMLALYGRRVMIEVLFILFVVWIVTRMINIYSWNSMLVGLVTVLIFGVLSNVYNSYRTAGLTSNAIDASDVSIIDALGDYSITTENLKSRQPPWLWNYAILDVQVTDGTYNPIYGKLLLNQFIDKIPRILWTSKGIRRSADKLVAEHYGLPQQDSPDNMFAFALGEWGHWCLIVTPLMMYTYVFVNALLIWLFDKHPLAVALIAGTCLSSICNVETSDVGRFLASRTTIIFLLTYIIIFIIGIHVRCIGKGSALSAMIRNRAGVI